MDDLISRQAAIDALKKISFSHWFECGEYLSEDTREIKIISSNKALEVIEALPSAQPTEASCWGCNCQKMERLKEQKTFSEMVHLHDAETYEERTETHACDLISRQALCEYALNQKDKSVTPNDIMRFPSAQPEFAKDKNVPSNDCVSRQAAIDCVCYDQEYTIECLKKLPSVQSEIKPIDYQDCANAMLRMWMDEVVTDGEYNRIMDKLNAFWRTRNERSD